MGTWLAAECLMAFAHRESLTGEQKYKAMVGALLVADAIEFLRRLAGGDG